MQKDVSALPKMFTRAFAGAMLFNGILYVLFNGFPSLVSAVTCAIASLYFWWIANIMWRIEARQ